MAGEERVNATIYELTSEEARECSNISIEGKELASKMRDMAAKDGHGLFVFMAMLDCIHRAYPGSFRMIGEGLFPGFLMEWISAGKPEDMADVPRLMLQRYGREKYMEIRGG